MNQEHSAAIALSAWRSALRELAEADPLSDEAARLMEVVARLRAEYHAVAGKADAAPPSGSSLDVQRSAGSSQLP